MVLGLIIFIHVVISLFLIAVVLLQQGKGADLSVFGGGGTMTAFGAQGAATLLHKLTVISFILFIVTTMLIGLMQTDLGTSSVMSGVPSGDGEAAPVAAAATADDTETDGAEATQATDDATMDDPDEIDDASEPAADAATEGDASTDASPEGDATTGEPSGS